MRKKERKKERERGMHYVHSDYFMDDKSPTRVERERRRKKRENGFRVREKRRKRIRMSRTSPSVGRSVGLNQHLLL